MSHLHGLHLAAMMVIIASSPNVIVLVVRMVSRGHIQTSG